MRGLEIQELGGSGSSTELRNVNSTTDLVIVGAGPAGSAAGIWAAQQGLSTVLVDRVSVPRLTPGECFHPGLEPILESLGVLTAVLSQSCVRPVGRTMLLRGQAYFERFGTSRSVDWLCSGQPIPDTTLSFSSATAGANP